MFRALTGININVQKINTSEVSLSTIVDADHGEAGHQAELAVIGVTD